MLESEEGQASSAKHKLGQAKNSKEYVAAEKEIDSIKESVANRQAEAAKLVEPFYEELEMIRREREQEMR